MSSLRKICVVITARPSYSRIKTVLESIDQNKNLQLQIVLGGSALLEKYGSVVDIIENDGFNITEKAFYSIESTNLTSAPKTTGMAIVEISSIFAKIKPHIVITIADRYETIATAIAASYMNITLCHIQGGEVTGNIDEKVRHAITKLSDYHFVASKDAFQRVYKLGEYKKTIFNTGCPSIDLASEILKNRDLNFNPYLKYGGVGSKPIYKKGYWIVMQHPVTTEYMDAKTQIKETLEAVIQHNETVFLFWPNIDIGSDETSKCIRAFRESKKMKNIHFFKNMEPLDFLKLLFNSKGIIGNSSVGIRECSFLGTPAINIGTRQTNRVRGKNVIDVDYDKYEILKAIKKHSSNRSILRSNTYGNGDAGKRITDILVKIDLKFNKIIRF